MKKYLLALVSSVAYLACYAQPGGSPDATFGTGGIVTTSFGPINIANGSVAVQGDGKIIMAGYIFNGSNNSFTLARYNTDGSLDITFDGDGKLTTLTGTACEANAITIQPDGKIIVAGSSFDNAGTGDDMFTLARYNTDGSLDNTFDADGIVTTVFAGTISDIAHCIVIQTDGKIVVAGSHHNGITMDFALARYNTDGSLDNSFDTDGKLTTAIGTSDDIAYSVALQTDGKIVVAGNSDIGGNFDFALARYNTNGSLDNTFDGDGKLTISIGFAQDAAGLAIQTDGKILIAGSTGSDFAVARYNINGSLDNSFDGDGKVITPVGTSNAAEANSIEIQSNGKIIVAGFAFVGAGRDFAVVRYNTDGTLDNTFDGDGKVTTNINGNDIGYAMKLSGQRIYVAGNSSSSSVFTLVAYQTGSLTLPLQLINFIGYKQNNSAVLNWQTGSEQNTLHFDIERSSDGNHYLKIGQVQASVNSATLKNYSFTDQQPIAGRGYYRLKMSDADGHFKYSGAIVIKISILASVEIFPNPVQDVLQVLIPGLQNGRTVLQLQNAEGKIIRQQTISPGAGQLSATIDVSGLSKAVYFLVIKQEDIITIKKFIKN